MSLGCCFSSFDGLHRGQDQEFNFAALGFARSNDAGTAFEPQRNLMHHSFGLDGGGSIAADHGGNVLVAWHGIGDSEAKGTGKEGEARRRVWVTKSEHEGQSFVFACSRGVLHV